MSFAGGKAELGLSFAALRWPFVVVPIFGFFEVPVESTIEVRELVSINIAIWAQPRDSDREGF